MIKNEISLEDFMTIINKERKYWQLKERIDEKLIWLKKVKKIGINEVIKRNEFINNSLKSQK